MFELSILQSISSCFRAHDLNKLALHKIINTGRQAHYRQTQSLIFTRYHSSISSIESQSASPPKLKEGGEVTAGAGAGGGGGGFSEQGNRQC